MAPAVLASETVRIIRYALAGLALLACGSSFETVPLAQRIKLDETGGLTCASNDDCWCRNFTGAEFMPGREPSSCCTQKDKDRFCPAPGVCQLCTYE